MTKKITITIQETEGNKIAQPVLVSEGMSAFEILGVLRYWEKNVWLQISQPAPKTEENSTLTMMKPSAQA